MDPCTQTPPLGCPIQGPPEKRVERFLPPVGSAAGAARGFVRTALRDWGFHGLIEDAVVIAGELFNNALNHARSKQYVLVVDWNGGMPRIEMWDSSDRLPEKRSPGIDSETGRGLHLIEALSTAWGSRQAASGKCVWAVL